MIMWYNSNIANYKVVSLRKNQLGVIQPPVALIVILYKFVTINVKITE